ncbi:hypothetical protein MYU51_002311 [Penicillium brevicompactum]|uniref:uncharacterized protein n=1 Tax=Penicillium brevicompactum TaxID=5074 RepID=UPI00253F730E|nr:uncharacterized protein N7506_003658 [Penicillium brevicompactum]KAJ5343834.1 hypothetical protein N7506_003658 [Penicillium brevicompactum]
MDITHPEGSVEREVERRRLDFVSKILMVGSDFQSTLGIAYLVTTFAQVSIMDTYHLHLVFDIASFVGVSNTAALVCWRYCRAKIDEPDMKLHGRKLRINYFNGRYRAVYLFVALYLALTILLGIRLNQWSPHHEPGRCYYSTLVTDPSSSHPAADLYYIGFTGSWLMVVVLASVFAGVKRRRIILVLSSLHFPLHLYMTIALRQANQGKFEGETNHENEWDFGQTTAVILLAIALIELAKKGKEYYDFESYVTKHGIPPSVNDREMQKNEEDYRSSSLFSKSSGGKNIAEDRRPALQEHASS